jgi:hypothetical protein
MKYCCTYYIVSAAGRDHFASLIITDHSYKWFEAACVCVHFNIQAIVK